MKKMLCKILMLCFVAGGLFMFNNSSAVFAKPKYEVVCINAIKGNTVYYYKCNTAREEPVVVGKLKKIKLSKKASFYVMPEGEDYSPEANPYRISKKNIQQKINASRKWNGKGFYVVIIIKNGKVTKIQEPYWP